MPHYKLLRLPAFAIQAGGELPITKFPNQQHARTFIRI